MPYRKQSVFYCKHFVSFVNIKLSIQYVISISFSNLIKVPVKIFTSRVKGQCLTN